MKDVLNYLIILAGLLLVSGCGGAGRSEQNLSAASEVLEPDEIRARIAAGDTPLTMVHLWATWCGPCVDEFPELVEMRERLSLAGVRVLLVSVDSVDNVEEVDGFLKRNQSPWSSLISAGMGEDLMDIFSPDWSGAIPATFFFGRDGHLLKWWSGAKSADEYEAALAELADEVAKQ